MNWEAMKDMNILRQTYQGHKRLDFDMMRGSFTEEIERFAKTKTADVLAILSHKRNLIQRWLETSSAQKIARKVDLPLLVIKDNAYELDDDLSNWLQFTNSFA